MPFFQKEPSVSFSGTEILVREEFCKVEEPKPEEPKKPEKPGPTGGEGGEKKGDQPRIRKEIDLKFALPKGKVSSLLGILNLLQTKFQTLSFEIHGEDGELTEDEFEDKIMEAFRQMGIEID